MKSFSFRMMVFNDDVDSIGIVHHGNYLKYMEKARLAWWFQQGFRLDKSIAEGILFVISKAELQFLKPARLYDRLEIVSHVLSYRRTAKLYEQIIRLEDNPEEIICKGIIQIVCVNEKLRPRALPPELVEEI